MRTFYLKRTAVLFFLFLGVMATYGQVKIGTNPQNIDLASLLELESTDKVIVISRVTTEQMEAITPLEGAMVYNTDAQCLHYYDGVAWINICEAFGNALTFTSNAIDNPGNFETIIITQTDNNYNFEVGILNASNIQNGTIAAYHLVTDAVTQQKIKDGAINSAKIADKSIQTIDIAPGLANTVLQSNGSTVAWAALDASVVTGRPLTGNDGSISITGVEFPILKDTDIQVAEGGITTIKLAADAVTTDKILDETILSGDIFDGTLLEADLADSAITTAKIADNAVTAAKINTDVAGEGLEKDAASGALDVLVDATTIEINATNGLQVAANGITVTQIADDAVTTDKIGTAGVLDADKLLGTNATGDPLWIDKTTIGISDFGAATADIDMGGFKITNVLDPTNPQDVATLNYVNTQVGTVSSLADGLIYLGNASNSATQVAISGDATLDNTGVLTIANDKITSAKIADDVIVDADVNVSAAIAGTKINPNFGAQNITTTGTLTSGNTTVTGTLSTTGATTIGAYTLLNTDGTNGQVLTTDGLGTTNWTTLPADTNTTYTNGEALSLSATNVFSVTDNTITSAKITDATIVDIDVASNAAIAGTKIAPDFGAQNVTTTGTLATGNATITGTLAITGQTTINSGANSTALPTIRGTANQILTTDGAGVATWTTPATAVREVADEFTATASQNDFTLTQTPSTNSKVKMYINGIRISNTAYSTSGTTLTYVPANNGGIALTAGDRIQFDYYY